MGRRQMVRRLAPQYRQAGARTQMIDGIADKCSTQRRTRLFDVPALCQYLAQCDMGSRPARDKVERLMQQIAGPLVIAARHQRQRIIIAPVGKKIAGRRVGRVDRVHCGLVTDQATTPSASCQAPSCQAPSCQAAGTTPQQR